MPISRIYGMAALKHLPGICRLIKENNIDIIQTFNIDSDIYGGILGKLCGVPVIISSRRDLGVYRKRRHLLLSKITNRFVTQFIAVCEAVAINLMERENVLAEKITTIYNGFDLKELSSINLEKVSTLRKQLNIGNNTFVIGNVSHFRPEKGYEIFFRAINEVRSYIPHLRVLAVGGGMKWLRYYQDQVHKMGLDEVVKFTGYVPQALDYISLMDICCLTPVSNEGFSNAILEQMALGKPIIATDVGGSREAIIDGESGIIIPPNDVDALVKAIIRLYNSEHLRRSLGSEAKKRLESHFRIEVMIKKMEDFYINLTTN
ncbi:MAG: glycosyltransferase [Calditrichaeota bacterium]|nr:MAG: glycosyltransferase [Calditrichota bacterium]